MIIDQLNDKVKNKNKEISAWLAFHSNRVLIPLYTSVDLRFSEHKIAPVDTNVFPSGFNNLTEEFQINSGRLFKDSIKKNYPSAKKILIVPELSTRNPHYWENIYVITTILEKVGFEIMVGVVDDEFTEPSISFDSVSGKKITAYRVHQKKDCTIYTEGFTPDVILINNDFSEECPKSLRNIRQPVLPPIEIGWHTRRKDIHFYFYNKLASELANILDLDPWQISIETGIEKDIDFDEPEGRQRAYLKTSELLKKISRQYSERNKDYSPSIFVKSNSGTYGMAVISVDDPEKIKNLNSKNRKKMKVSKGGIVVRDVVIQEGIPTSLIINKGSAEPVIYLVDGKVAGMFYRVNSGKDIFSNLNSSGMEFVKYNHLEENNIPDIFNLISQTATIATGYEIEKIIKEGGCNEKAV